MNTLNNKSRRKFTASIILFVIGALALGVIISLLFLLKNIEPLKVYMSWLSPVLMCLYFGSIGTSLGLNASYRKNSLNAGVGSTVLYVFQFIIAAPLIIFVVIVIIYGFFTGELSLSGGDKKLKKIKIKDDDGKVYILTQLYEGGNEFEDQEGAVWVTSDGINFSRKKPITADESGNEKILTPTYDDALTQHYQDQNGEEWKSRDGGLTFEHVVTKAEVTDELGNKYQLRAVQAGLDNFIDQNGDSWITYDGGKTFERR